MFFWTIFPLLCLEGQSKPYRTVQECTEDGKSQQNPPQNARAWENYYKSQGWDVRYGGKGWLKTPQNVSDPYEIPTEEGCVPRLVDMFLCRQCNKSCVLDWDALHSECEETKGRRIKDITAALVHHGVVSSELGHMLAEEIRSNIFGDTPVTFHVEDCAFSKLSVSYAKAVKSEGIVFNVTGNYSMDTTMFIIAGQDPIVSQCDLLKPENEWFCVPVHTVTTNSSNDEKATIQPTILVGVPLMFLLIFAIRCVRTSYHKTQVARDEERGPLLAGEADAETSYLLPLYIRCTSRKELIMFCGIQEFILAFKKAVGDELGKDIPAVKVEITEEQGEATLGEVWLSIKEQVKPIQRCIGIFLRPIKRYTDKEEMRKLCHLLNDLGDQALNLLSRMHKERLNVVNRLMTEYKSNGETLGAVDIDEEPQEPRNRQWDEAVIEANKQLKLINAYYLFALYQAVHKCVIAHSEQRRLDQRAILLLSLVIPIAVHWYEIEIQMGQIFIILYKLFGKPYDFTRERTDAECTNVLIDDLIRPNCPLEGKQQSGLRQRKGIKINALPDDELARNLSDGNNQARRIRIDTAVRCWNRLLDSLVELDDDQLTCQLLNRMSSVPGAPVGSAVATKFSPSHVQHPHGMNTVSNFHHRNSFDTGSGGSSSSPPIGSGPMGTISPGGGVYFPRSPRTAFSSSPSTPSPLTEMPHSSSASALPSMSSQQQQQSQHPITIAERPFRVLQPHESLACGLASPLSYGEPLRMGLSQPQPSLIKPVPIRPQMPPPIQSGSRSAFSSPFVSHRNERPLTVTAEVTYLSTENRSTGPTRTNSDESVRIARDIMGSTAVDSPRRPAATEFMFDNDLTSPPQTGDVNSARAQMDVLMRKNQKSGGSRASASQVSARTVHTNASQPHLNPAPSSAFDSPQPFPSSSSRPAFEPATSDSIWRPTPSGFMFDCDLTSHPHAKVNSAQMDALMRKNMEKKNGGGGTRVSRGSEGAATNRNQIGLGGGRGKGGSTLRYRPPTDERYQEEPPRQKTAQETQNEIQSYQRVLGARRQAEEARQRMLKKKKKMGIVDESNEDSVVPAGAPIERDPNFVAPTERGLHNQQRAAADTGLGVAGSSGASAEGTGTSTSSDKLAAGSTEMGSTSADIRMRENERRCHEMCTRIADFVNYDPRSPIPTPSVDVVFEKSIHNVDRFVEQLTRRSQNCIPDNESYSILINGMAHPPELVPRDRQQLLRPVIVDACAVAHAYSTYYKPYWGETSVSQPYHTERVMPMQPLLDVALHFITAGHQVNIVMPKLYESPYYRGKQSRPLVNDVAIYEALRSAGIMSFADPVKSPRRKDLLQVIRQMVRKVDGCFVSNVDVERTYAPRRLEDPADLPLNALPDSVFEKRPAVTDSSPSKVATASDCESSPKMTWSNEDDEPAVPMVMCRTAAADTIDMTQVKRQRVHAESALRLLTPSFVGPGKMMVILHQFHQFVGGSDVAHDQRKKYYECVGERTVLMYTERDGDQADYGIRVGCQLKIRDQLRQLLILSTARPLGAAHMRTIQVIARLARLCNLDVPELDSFVTRFATAPAPSTPTPELDESLELEEDEQDGESASWGVSDAGVPSTSSPLIPISPINSPVCGRSDSPEDLISFNQPHLSEDALAVMEPTRDGPSTSSEAVSTPSSTPRDTTPEVGQLISISPPTVSSFGVDDEKETKSPNSTTRSSSSESVSFFSVLDTANLDEYVDNELADVLLPINLSTSSTTAAVPIPQSTSSNVDYDYEDYFSDRTLSPIDMDFSEYVTED